MGSILKFKEDVLPSFVMNLSVCFAVVATTTDSIKYLFWFFIVFHIFAIYKVYR
jgi:hypothetical protein